MLDTIPTYVEQSEPTWFILSRTAGISPRALVIKAPIKSSYISNISHEVAFQTFLTDYALCHSVWDIAYWLSSVPQRVEHCLLTILCATVFGTLLTYYTLCHSVWNIAYWLSSVPQRLEHCLLTILCATVLGTLLTDYTLCHSVWNIAYWLYSVPQCWRLEVGSEQFERLL
jgi:hypothetical protein